MKILLVTGMPGAGKEELLNVARSMDIPFLRMGDIVREFHQTSGAAERGLSVGQVANGERELHGKDIWAKRAIERMSGDIFLVDGCRSLDEVDSYKGLSDSVYIIGVHAPRSVRYDRLVKRGREDAPNNMAEFDERDNRELGWGLGNVIALSDIMIINDSDLESFQSKVKKELEALR
ncbi:MAG: AAA family ATPase [Candidatus Methanomethylophilaceae archaeon]|nr:AAA family ATPase [Candidatus Methanomethylophilaceae archaeon]MBR6911332.1 AAA family ATPase [Candidatus Methanomethylophilaceae archaeon]